MNLSCLTERFALMGEQTAVLTGRWHVFRSRRGAGAICYRLQFGTALVPGDPLCDAGDAAAVLDEFLEMCRAGRWHAVFIPASQWFARLAGTRGCAGWKIGETPEIDLLRWSCDGKAGAALRAALNRARRGGVIASEWWRSCPDGVHEAALNEVRDAWLGYGRRVPLGFVLGGDALQARRGRRWFVARTGGAVQAFVVTAALPARNGVAIEQFIRRPGAEYGSVELALAAALAQHRSEGATFASLGLAPLRGLAPPRCAAVDIIGEPDRGHRTALSVLRMLRRLNSPYPARSLEHFKAKFNPSYWEPAYLVHYPRRLQPRMAVAAALELLPGGPPVWIDHAVSVAARAAGARRAGR